jgi:hypothetical protein
MSDSFLFEICATDEKAAENAEKETLNVSS